MTVGIADVAALLELVLFRRRQEFSTPGAPFAVHGLDVFNPDIKEAADPVGITRRLQDDRQLVVGRSAAAIDDDPALAVDFGLKWGRSGSGTDTSKWTTSLGSRSQSCSVPPASS
jgi:hypothetical protein